MITSFAGLRAHEGRARIVRSGGGGAIPGFIDCSGLDRRGLKMRRQSGKMVAGILKEKMDLKEDPEFSGDTERDFGSVSAFSGRNIMN